MIGPRTIAALVGGAAALAVFAGLAGVRADPLQTNQPLLGQRIDQPAAPGLNLSTDQNPAAGSFPHSILLPGTNTSLRVYGETGETLGYRLGGGNPGVPGKGSFSQSPGPTELGVETRTPTPLGEARTVVQFGN